MWKRNEALDRKQRKIWHLLCVASLLVLLVSMIAVPAAQARKTHPYLFSFTPGNGADVPAGIGVNQTTNELFVVGELKGVVYRFNQNGQPNAAHPTLTGIPAGFHPHYVAVDNSGTATAGSVYVSGETAIQQFSPAGAATGVNISESAIPANGTPQGGGLANVVNNGIFEPRPVAVDASGNIYAKDKANKAIDKFSSTGTFVAQYAAGVAGEEGGVAVAPSGDIYLANSTAGLIKRNSNGECVNSCTPIDSARAEGVAIDAAGNVDVTVELSEAWAVREYSAAGTLASESTSNHFLQGKGIALDESTGRVFAVNLRSSAGPPAVTFGVAVFGPTVVLPDATTQAPTGVSSTSATLNGQVSAAEGSPATCQFEFVTAAQFAAHGFEGAQTAACEPAGPFTGGGTNHVQHTVEVVGGTSYRYRLVASSQLGSTQGAAETFTTLGPSVVSETASAISESGATLEASINPRGQQTTYHFQYVDQARFEVSKFVEATKVPVGGAEIGSGSVAVPVSQGIGGLVPGTIYHFRVVATNAGGVTTSIEAFFQTYSAAGAALPDDRRYEQVSPTNKNGANLQLETNAIQASADGDGFTFFINAGLPGGEGAQSFPSYLATRLGGELGWSTQGLLPPAATGNRGRIAGWTEDLEYTFVTNRASVAVPPVLYLRRNGDHSLAPIVSGGEGTGRTFSVADSAGPWVLFESRTGQLAAGAAANRSNTYLWNANTGEVVLAGMLNNKKAPPLGSFAGPYDWFISEETSAGGAGARYYMHAENVLSAGGSRVFFTAGGTGQIYMRKNPGAPQSTLAGNGACKEPERACTIQISAPEAGVVDPQGEKPAAFIGATADGSTAFFLSAADLTEDAATGTGSGKDLYRYNAESGQLTDLTPDEADEGGADVQGVLGISESGDYVYFAANGVLAPGATPGDCRVGEPVGECNLYVLHGATPTFITRVQPGLNGSGGSDLSDWGPTSLIRGGGVTTQENVGRVTPDGKTLLFRSAKSLTGYENKGFTEVYRYRVGDAGPTCVSCNPTNAAATGNAAFQDMEIALTGPRLESSIMTRNLSADGNRVFFETPDGLVANDVNGVGDVYEWEAEGSGSCHSAGQNGGCIYLMSTGSSPLPSHFGDASVNANDVFFFTAQALVKQDQDELVDVYDARVNGGLASQEAQEATPCEGERCLGPATQGGELPAVGTGAVMPGNPKRIKCKPHFKRTVTKGKERCVRVKQPHKKKSGHGKRHKRIHGKGGGR
jgi:hypothetical protein